MKNIQILFTTEMILVVYFKHNYFCFYENVK